MGMSFQRRCSKTPALPTRNAENLLECGVGKVAACRVLCSKLTNLCPPDYGLVATGLANLVGADPFALDGPGAVALMIWVIASKVAVFDQSSAGVPTVEVDDFELAANQYNVVNGLEA